MVTSYILQISIHSPHARGDAHVDVETVFISISIHSPHARGDATTCSSASPLYNFNPLPSCEGRLLSKCLRHSTATFQSTPLMRGETDEYKQLCNAIDISIHSPHARGDVSIFIFPLSRVDYFNPLPSCEGRPGINSKIPLRNYFNPLPSCEGRQHKLPKNPSNSRQFIQHNSFCMIL